MGGHFAPKGVATLDRNGRPLCSEIRTEVSADTYLYMRPRIYADNGSDGSHVPKAPTCTCGASPKWFWYRTSWIRSNSNGMPVFKYEGYYFGLLQIYYSDSKVTIEIQLAFSSDGKKWERLPTRDLFLGLGMLHGQGADFDSGLLLAGTPVVVGDELRFYYTGYRAAHTDFQNYDHPGQD